MVVPADTRIVLRGQASEYLALAVFRQALRDIKGPADGGSHLQNSFFLCGGEIQMGMQPGRVGVISVTVARLSGAFATATGF